MSEKAGEQRPGAAGDAAGPADAGRRPGWREVLVISGAVLVAVFGLWYLTSRIPALEAAFLDVPTTIVVLAVGTVAVLALALRRRTGG